MNSHIQNIFTGATSPVLVHEWVLKGKEDCIKIQVCVKERIWESNLEFPTWLPTAHPTEQAY